MNTATAKATPPWRILITGASIAGNTAALWLGDQGCAVTVVERAAEFRDGGQNIDIRGVGREVMRRMGLEQAALAADTGEEGTAWVDGDGRIAASFINAEMGTEGMTAEMEILRGDLARLLYEPAAKIAEFRFGDSIKRIEDGSDDALVTFASGRSERFDLVIVAEGVGSSTRELVFPKENDPRWMDLTMTYFTISRIASDDRLWRWYNAPASAPSRCGRTGTGRPVRCWGCISRQTASRAGTRTGRRLI